jgi:small subunit ribosomal protein S18
MAGPKRFNKDKRPKRPAQNLLFKRKRFCRFTVTGVVEDRLQGHGHAA